MDSQLSRRPIALPSEKDLEKDPLLPTEEDDKYTKPRSRPAFKLVLSTPALLLAIATLVWLTTKSRHGQSAFPFPRPSPSRLPDFVEEGIEQCKVVQRGVGEMAWDKTRKENDR